MLLALKLILITFKFKLISIKKEREAKELNHSLNIITKIQNHCYLFSIFHLCLRGKLCFNSLSIAVSLVELKGMYACPCMNVLNLWIMRAFY